MPRNTPTASSQVIEHLICFVRGQRVMLDSDLASLYGVKTKALNQAVKRNQQRFPSDFMFPLSEQEARIVLLAKSGSASSLGLPKPRLETENEPKTDSPQAVNWSQIVTSSLKHRGSTYKFYAFTEQGVAMLSSVLRSQQAVQVNVEIMRAFVRLRQWLASNALLAKRLDALEGKYDRKFRVVFDAIRELMRGQSIPRPRREIGFHTAISSRNSKIKAIRLKS